MTRAEAIATRATQLQGGHVEPALLAEALQILRVPGPRERAKPGPKIGTKYQRRPEALGLRGVKARTNRVLLKNLKEATSRRDAA